LYELAKKLIFAETSIESSVCYHEVVELASRIKPSRSSEKIIKYVKNIYFKNIGLLKERFTPETNNTMEQLFSLVNSFIEQARSFKTKSGLSNFCYNLFAPTNKRCFNTGKWRGFSPLDRAKLKFGCNYSGMLIGLPIAILYFLARKITAEGAEEREST